MNDMQLDKVKKELREEMNSKGYGWINGTYHKPPTELGYEKRQLEFNCIEMINSILAYDWSGQSAEEIMQMEENSRYNYLDKYVDVLGREKVVDLIQGQMNDIDHIARNVGTDNEGISYNSIVWKEE